MCSSVPLYLLSHTDFDIDFSSDSGADQETNDNAVV
jgi:hypothetical protein